MYSSDSVHPIQSIVAMHSVSYDACHEALAFLVNKTEQDAVKCTIYIFCVKYTVNNEYDNIYIIYRIQNTVHFFF